MPIVTIPNKVEITVPYFIAYQLMGRPYGKSIRGWKKWLKQEIIKALVKRSNEILSRPTNPAEQLKKFHKSLKYGKRRVVNQNPTQIKKTVL
jgi:hypothetical protein